MPDGAEGHGIGAGGCAGKALGTPVLRILATTDLHGELLAWDHHADRSDAGRGLARVATLIAEARAEAGLCLLLDNGDFLTGSPLVDQLAAGPAGTAAVAEAGHPVVQAMNALGYDAAGLGNHEFSLGLPYLAAALRQARFPVLSANLAPLPGAPALPVRPGVILRRALADGRGQMRPLSVGVVSALPARTAQWEAEAMAGRFATLDILPALRSEVARLRAEGAEVVVVLAHAGLSDADDPAAPGAALLPAIAALPGVDALVAGHSHEVFPRPGQSGRIGAAAAVLPGALGSHLGVIDLQLARRGGRWRVVAGEGALRPVSARGPAGLHPCVADDAGVVALARPLVGRLRRRAARVVGIWPAALDSHFATIRPSALLAVMAGAMAQAARAALRERPDLAGLPVLAAVAPPRAGGRGGPANYCAIPAGALRQRHLGDIFPHPDRLVAFAATGADVARWLEQSATLFASLPPGTTGAELFTPDPAAFHFDVFPALDYGIDLTRPAGAGRIVGLSLNGQPLQPEAQVVLVTRSHRATGGGGFPLPQTPPHSIPLLAHGPVLRDCLAAWLRAGAPDLPRGRWQLQAAPGTTALFDGPPDAPPPDPAIEALDLTEAGFRRFRLRF